MAIARVRPKLNPSKLLSLLIKHGANVNIATNAGETALQECAIIRYEDGVRLLLESGADVNAKTEAGETALHWAAGYNETSMVKLLLEHKADVNAKTEGGETPLHWAIQNNRDTVKQLLCEHGANPIAEGLDTELIGATAAPQQSPTNTKIWGLLIGINHYRRAKAQSVGDYSPYYPELKGCVNDIILAEEYMSSVLNVPSSRIVKLVTGPEVEKPNTPTYSNIIQALQYIDTHATSGDSVYIHYSGHSAQVPTSFPLIKGIGRSDKALIPTDIHTVGQYLRDLELEYIFRGMADNGLGVTVVLDCNYLEESGTAGSGKLSRENSIVSDDKPALFKEITKWAAEEALQHQGKCSILEPERYTLFTASLALEIQSEDSEVKHYGLLTHNILKLLRRNPRSNVSCRTIYRRLRPEFNEVPAKAVPILVGEADRSFHGTNIVERVPNESSLG
jgi:Caspase domain/Ankyrin repeats (3 copies)